MAQKRSRVRNDEDLGSFVASDGHIIRAADEYPVAENDEFDDLEDHDGPETDDDRAGVL
jgi:hypothetical protein